MDLNPYPFRDMGKKFRSFSKRLSLRIIIVVLAIMALMASIAEDAGFKHLRTMQRRLMEVIGMTPAEYRALYTRDLALHNK